MTPVGPDPHPPPPRPSPRERPALPHRRRGGAARARAARPPGRAPYPRPRRRRAAPSSGPPRRSPALRLVATLLVLLRRLRGDRRAAGPGPGARRRGVRRLRRVAALPGHHPARRPRLDLRPQRQRPGGEPPAADGVGEPVADQAPARGGRRPRRSARPRRRGHATQLAEKLAGDAAFTYVARRVDDEVAAAIEDLDLPGIVVPRGAQALHAGRRPGPLGARQVGVDNDGLFGLERQYDDALTGEPGDAVIEKDPEGRTIPGGDAPAGARPQRGDDLVLTIDRSMQYETERALAAQILAKGAKGGTAIVSRPATGEILALANFTTDPETGAIVATGNNMGATAVYEPGSVNKVITVAAALEEGLVTPEHRADGARLAAGERPPLHRPRPAPHRELLGDADPHRVVEHRHDQAGPDAGQGPLRHLPASVRLRHHDRPRLPERGGRACCSHPEDYSGTSIGSIPIGQGIAVTAMQMLEAYNVLANDGVYVPPKLVHGDRRRRGRRAIPSQAGEPRRVVSEATAEQMREMLVNVVAEGTGTRGGITGYSVAGKTGTARKPLPEGGYQRRRRQLPLRRQLRRASCRPRSPSCRSSS